MCIMKILSLKFFIIIGTCFTLTEQQNSTERAQSGRRDSNVMNAIQQVQLQLNSLETENQRHSSRIQDILRATTRLESQRQEFIGFILDRSESHISQRLEDVKGDVRKITTIQDIIREDVDKIQQNQLLTKIWMEEQVQNIGRSFISRSEPAPDPLFSLANADILTNLQILQSTLQGLRRMADTLQSSINIVKANLTDLTNITKSISKYEKETLVNKSYLQSSLLTLTDEKVDPFLTGCSSPLKDDSAERKLPRDCLEVQRDLKNETGVYRIQPDYARRPIFVFCDMETDGGGWTVFQRRKDGSIDFLRQWKDYKYGFGNIGGEFWLGNENLYLITHQDLYELRVDLEDFDGGKGFALYDGFAVGSEKEKYMLKFLGPFKAGDAGDGMTYHASIPFSTIDIDHDFWEGGHCAKDHTGGWWYNQCEASNLNGKYLNGLNPQEYQGVYWHEWHGPNYSLMSTKMMIRPKFREVPKPSTEGQEIKPLNVDFK